MGVRTGRGGTGNEVIGPIIHPGFASHRGEPREELDALAVGFGKVASGAESHAVAVGKGDVGSEVTVRTGRRVSELRKVGTCMQKVKVLTGSCRLAERHWTASGR